MKNNKTELVFVLDRSGSMAGLEGDTIGGFNSMLEKQKKIEGEVNVTTVLFDHEYELLHDRFNLRDLRPLSDEDYFVRGSTALLDAIGITIGKMVRVQKNQSNDAKAERVMFVIITDGMENASRKFNYSMIKKMINHEEENYGWEFIFLGANIDAAAEAERMGIHSDRNSNFIADSKGTHEYFNAVEKAVTSVRQGRELDKEWKKSLDEDFENRKK